MALSIAVPIVAFAALSWFSAGTAALELNVSAISDTVDSDWTAVYYSDSPLLLGNDGGTSTGGFHAFDLNGDTPLPVAGSVANGRTALVATIYGVADRDWLLTIATADSLLRAFELPHFVESEGAAFPALGDWSSLCSWKSRAGNQYAFLFGKEEAIQFLVRPGELSLEFTEVSRVLLRMLSFRVHVMFTCYIGPKIRDALGGGRMCVVRQGGQDVLGIRPRRSQGLLSPAGRVC